MKMIYKSFAISLLALTTLSHTYNNQVSAKAKVSEHATQSVDDLRFIGSQTVPYNTQFDHTKVGGISGITYQPTTHRWLLISDDRSEQNPSRCYEAKLNYNQNHFNKIKLQSMHLLKQPNGSNYTNKNHYKDNPQDIVADPESIRFDPLYKQIMYTTEGDRSLGLNPFIRLASLQGDFITEIPISHTQKMDQHAKHGFRNNLALEGSTFSADGHSIWTATEAPLIQDGKSPTPTTEGLSRITQYDRQGRLLNEYAYRLDAIPKSPGKGKEAENGVSELLAINNHEFLTLERASVQSSDNSYHNYVRIYKINTDQATDIKNQESLKQTKIHPVKKELIADLNKEDIGHIDNIEGITFGKQLPNEHDSIVIVADNNFNKAQKQQLMAFEVIPK